MASIEITTPQQVIVRYELAAWWERWLALVIDLVGIIVWTFIASMVHNNFEALGTILYFLIATYTLFFEAILGGRTPGKLLVGIKVVKLSGEKTTFTDYFMRWSFRWIDIWLTLGALATIMMMANDRRQRLGDLLSDTVVIKFSKNKRMSMERLGQLDALDKYTPKFPAILQYTEDDMLVLKEVLERYLKYKSPGSKLVMQELLVKINDDIGIARPPKLKPENFIKTLIKDYVALTR